MEIEMTESKKLTKKEKSALSVKLKARRKAAELVKMEDPIKYLVEADGLTIGAARQRMRQYKIKYPDLFKIPFKSKTEIRKEDYEAAMASGDPTKYYAEKFGISYDAAWHRWKYAQKSFDTPIQNKENEENVMGKDSEARIIMNGMTLDQIAKQVIKDKVRIIIDITPNEDGTVTQHIEVEPWEPLQMKCPYKD